MIIGRIQVFEYDAAWVHGDFGMSHGRSARAQRALVVRVTTDEGIEGWAEICPNGRTYLPSFAEGERAALEVLGPALLGADPRNLGRLNQMMDAELLGANAAKSAIDMACHDILGQAVGLPVCDLLGGRMQDSVPLFVAVPVDTVESMAGHVEREVANGIRVFQVKVGDDPATDASRVRAVLEAAGPECTVIADANGGWNLQSALLAARALDGLPVRLEQPCRTMADCARLRKHTSLPMILDECVVTIEDLMLAKFVTGAGGINLKPSRVGGFTRARAIRDTAQGLGMTFTVDDTWGGAVTGAQNVQFAASCARESLTGATSFADWIEPLVATVPPAVEPGRAAPGELPGLGVSVHVDMLGRAVLDV